MQSLSSPTNPKRACPVLILLACASHSVLAQSAMPPDEPLSLWFDKPGGSFHESCVLGNGRLGTMDFGGVEKTRIVLNESSLWSGGAYDGNRYGAYQVLPEVREKLFATDISGAWKLMRESFRYADGIADWSSPAMAGRQARRVVAMADRVFMVRQSAIGSRARQWKFRRRVHRFHHLASSHFAGTPLAAPSSEPTTAPRWQLSPPTIALARMSASKLS